MVAIQLTFYRPTTRSTLWGTGLFAVFCICSVLVQTLPKNRDEYLMYLSSPVVSSTSGENWANANDLDSGSISFMIMCTGLVLFMTPGLAFFYGGMVRQKNMISTLLNSYALMGFIMILWVLVGYSLAYGENVLGGLIGNPATHYFFKNVGAQPAYDVGAPAIPESLFAMYQATFAIITPAIITGSVVERARFNALMLFCGIWHLVVYCPFAHMMWSPNGLIHTFGVKDFAGGTVVHLSCGVSAYVLAKLLGERIHEPGTKESLHTPAHVPYVLLGTAILWFGWIGNTAGSALSAGVSASQSLAATLVSASSCLCAWILWDYILGRKVGAVSACCGAVIGLVVISPASGYVTVGSAMIIGMIGAVVCNSAITIFKHNTWVDDSLDVFACHGIGGFTGMTLTSCFASPHVTPGDPDELYGLFYGYTTLFWHTLVVTVVSSIYFIVATTAIYYFVNAITPFRVTEDEEREGLDSLHGEIAILPYTHDKDLEGIEKNWDINSLSATEPEIV